jgi:CBS domain-containing protein
MADASAEHTPAQQLGVRGTVADVMRQPLTTVELNDHVAAAAYIMKHADATALIVLDAMNDQPIGIITEADVTRAVADGKNVNEVRISELMTARPQVIAATTSVFDAAKIMTDGRFRHLPVMGDEGLTGIVDVTDVCRALIDPGSVPA